MQFRMDIFAAGMVSPIGPDLKTSCAAARAGISRPSQIPCRIKGNDNGPELAVGHCVTGLTDGFAGDARLIRLMTGALEDLFSAPSLNEMPSDIGWYLGIPDSERRRSGLDRIASPEARSSYEETLQGTTAQPPPAVRGERILNDALKLALGTRRTPVLREVSTAGHVAFASLVNSAKRDLAAGDVTVAIVGCVDSMVTEPDLRWLNATRRLKSGENPVGMAAGEAAAIVALVSRAQGTALARLYGVRLARSRSDSFTPEPTDGTGLVEILRSPMAEADGRNLAWIVADQNGETHRAADLYNAFTRLRVHHPGYELPHIWYPAIYFGDTGTASGAVNTCVALHAFRRQFAPEPIAGVVSRNDGFDASVVLIGNA